MEDNKNGKMHVLSNKETAVPEQPSYEQLKYWLDKAISDNKNLVGQLNEVTHILNFLPYLFKVVEMKDSFNSDFVNQCKDSIVNVLTPVKKADIATAELKEKNENVVENKGE